MALAETVLRRRALKIEQDPEHPLFLFALTPQELIDVADISRISRDDTGKLVGYQRPEVRRHVKNIVDYLESGKVLFPNSIILALSSKVSFRQVRGPKVDDGLVEAGTLEIPMSEDGKQRPAWIVDGQQRALALSKSRNKDIVIPISGFIADDVESQRDQFLRINSAKPLPRGLITELLPEVTTTLPPNLALRKAPSAICDLLNKSPESPFYGLIKRSSGKLPNARVGDAALVASIAENLNTPSGCLFPYRNVATGETDYDSVMNVLITYWTAVRDTFPDAWAAAKTGLLHGVGIRAMGRLMDRLMGSIDVREAGAGKLLREELSRIKPYCRWTSGVWEELDPEHPIAWNDLQYVQKHIRLLSSFLIRAYVSQRWTRP